MSATAPELVADEMTLMRRVLPLAGARVLDLGCGNGAMTRRLAEGGLVRSATGLEVDGRQHEANVSAPPLAGLSFAKAGADEIPFSDASFEVATMFKSLHHVPLDRLDRALAEIRRVLVPGGMLYVSEPVAEGPFNEVVRLFHDESHVRAEALAAIERAAARGVMDRADEIFFMAPISFRDFDDFDRRIIQVTHTDHQLDAATLAEVRRRFEAHMTRTGANFVRPMRANVLRRPN